MEAYTNTVGVRLLDLPLHLDREYSYYVPETLCFSPVVGDFAVVPFGGANKKHIALITSVGKTNDYGKLKPILTQINRSLSLSEEMMELIHFLCGRTLCTMGDAVRRLIPADAFAKATEFFSPTVIDADTRDTFSPRIKAVFAFIESHAPVREERLIKEFSTEVSPILRKLLSEGHITSELTIKESKGASLEMISPIPTVTAK